ncbi:MAG: pilus assembly protein [Ramlibacter sp.]
MKINLLAGGRRLIWATGVVAGLLLASTAARSEDIDIFTAGSTGTAGAPNIMFLLDNSANWSRASQKWPDSSGNQGESELEAIQNLLAGMSTTTPINMGLALYNQSGSSYGGYIRFGSRDMTVAANRTAFSNILGGIRANINSPNEKVAQNSGEAEALYELHKYFSNTAPYLGGLSRSPNLDIAGNAGASSPYTAVGQGLSTSHAIVGGTYSSPVSSSTCGRSYVVLIANNANGTYPAGSQTYETTSAGNAIPGTAASWTDEWARYLYQSGVSVYVLDAYNAQNNAAYSSVLQSAARNAGGKYFQVGNQAEIESALKQIMAEILSVNSTFATASLPISATNRSQSLNQVFIGMFRPDPDGAPRWMGNLKRYQLVTNGGAVDLGDALGVNAINLQTGFVSECAASYWTTDSGSYWQDVPVNPVPSSTCTAFPTVAGLTGSRWSDLPDGPTVEKGGVAEILRKGNAPPTSDTSPTWLPNRTLYTLASASSVALVTLSASTTGLSGTLVNWISGSEDAAQGLEKTSNTGTSTRPSIHGDVIHSRPLPVNYGGSTGVTVFYGANDGLFRAVDAATGRERWGFAAPEFFPRLQRLHDNSPMVNYPTLPSGITPTPVPKDYFFDGSIGLYQKADNSRIWIFPTMRRGGRMVYAMDVTNPASPTVKWRVGCPNLTNDTGCTAGFSAMGQTWSTPNVGFMKGYSTSTPLVVVGGGYDGCEDANGASPACGSRKGNAVYVINADTGSLVASFSTSGSVPADIVMSDVNADGSVDYAYVADTTGNLYRIDFSSTTGTPLASSAWGMRKVAYTSGGGRKFLYPPALLNVPGKMYVALGTGDREHPLNTHYPYSTPVTNRFYVFLDDLSVLPTSTTPAVAMDSDGAVKDYTTAPACAEAGVTPGSGLKGWRMDLTGRGEQSITSALIAGGLVTFNTNRATPSAGTCSASLGESRGYWMNLLNSTGTIGTTGLCGGDRSSAFIGGGLTPSPTLATVEINGKPTTVVIGSVQRTGGASSGIAPQRVKPSISSRRRFIFWKSDAASE